MPDSCEPPLDFNVGGWAETDSFRIRTGWFGFAVLEQLIVYRDGSSAWKRRPAWRGAVVIQRKQG